MKKEDYIREFLNKRGCTTPEERRAYFDFDENVLRRVADMCGGKEILDALADAAAEQKFVVIYGDYDADGIMASFILYSGLERLIPGRVKIFINNRFEDGYSITPESIRKLLELYPDTEVIITCDNGIAAAEAFESVRERGLTILVTDHHEQPGQSGPVPGDIPMADEKSLAQMAADEADGIAREEFCGAELARRVVTELYDKLGLAEENRDFLDGLYAYSGFATITDSVPMNPANHYVAKRGLEMIRADRGFFQTLRNESGHAAHRVSADTVGFYFGPLFNAAGRVAGTAKNALAAPVLYAMGYEKECAQAVKSLLSLNEKRKEMCRREDSLAFRMIEENGWDRDPFILVAGSEFSEGINGLTAAHIVNRYGVPAAVLSPVRNDSSLYKGSARSREGFDLFRSFTSHPGLIKAGGHPMAAGLALKKEDLEEVRALLCRDAEGIVYSEPEADFLFTPGSISLEDVRAMQEAFEALEPFGPGFEPPRICITGEVYPVRPLKEVHAKMTMQQRSSDGYYIDLIWWNHLEEAQKITGAGSAGNGFTFMGEPSVNEYAGRCSIQFKISELR